MYNRVLNLWQKIFAGLIIISGLLTIAPIVLPILGLILASLLRCRGSGASFQCGGNEQLGSILSWMFLSHWFALITIPIGGIFTSALIAIYVLIREEKRTNKIYKNLSLKNTFRLLLISSAITIAPIIISIAKSITSFIISPSYAGELFDSIFMLSFFAVPIGAILTISLFIVWIVKRQEKKNK